MGTARAQGLSEEEAIKKLAKIGIKVYREEDRMNATVHVANEEALKALDLLRHFKRLDYLNMDITDAKLVKSSVDALKHTPTLKGLGINAKNGLASADLEGVVKLSNLEGLGLEGNEITAKQLQALGGLAKLERFKGLTIRTAKFPKEEAEQLKRVLSKRNFSFHHYPTIQFMAPLPIAPEESREIKLQKQKLNAAIADVVANLYEHNGFRGQSGSQSLDTLRLHNLRNAALDLDDADLRNKIIDDYVFITEQRYKHVKAVLDREPEFRRFDNSLLHIFEYEHADAQLTQLRLAKKADAKPK